MRRLAVLLPLLAVVGLGQRFAPLPPIPANPYEPVNGTVQMLQTPAERAAGLNLLNIAGQDYTFFQQGRPDLVISTSLQSSGNLRFEGAGTMTEIWGHGRTTWWADFDGERSGIGLDLKAHPVPLRVVLARGALLWPIPRQPTLREIRVAGAEINGKPVTCVLVTEAATLPNVPGRDWREAEYCMDGDGLLQLASPAPGVYFTYDYSGALQYAGHTVASGIHVIEGGNTVLSEQVTRLEAPNAADLQTLQDAPRGPGVLLTAAYMGFWPRVGEVPTQVNVVHLTYWHGNVIEAEVVGSSNPVSGETSLQRFKNFRWFPRRQWGEGEIWIRDARP